MPAIFKHIYVLFIVLISFIIFNSTTIDEAITTIKNLFISNSLINSGTIYYLKSYLPLILISLIGATPLIKNIYTKLSKNKTLNKILNILEPIYLIILLIIVTAYLIDSTYNPFLYFRF